jgi:hypothetical protein
MPNYIFQFPATCRSGAAFYDILNVPQKSYFFNEKPRSEDVQFKTQPKKSKIPR